MTVHTDARGFARFSLRAPVDLWWPGRPRLHDVQIAAETDEVEDRVGFRSLQVRGTELLVNGRSTFLRGISIHEQAPEREGRAHGRDDARALLGWAQELGANFVRLAHYPHDEAMLRTADEMGLLVWAEIPVYWTIDWENASTLENARTQLAEMIDRDRDRASVAVWSIANETPPGPRATASSGRWCTTSDRSIPHAG